MSRNNKPQQNPVQQTNPAPITQPTDTYIQPFLKQLVPELLSLEKLKDEERRIDVYLSRKKIDLHQSITQWTYQKQRDYKDTQYLRVFISTIAENQPWQTNTDSTDQATWTLRIEGRLVNDQEVNSPSRPKFSTFLQSIALDFHSRENSVDRDQTDTSVEPLAENGTTQVTPQSTVPPKKYDVVEWHADTNAPVEFDGLDIKRNGTENLDCTITIQPKGYSGDHLQYSDALSSIVGISRGTVHEAIYSLYKYILLNNLLIPDESVNSKSNQNDDKMVVKVDPMILKLLPVNAQGEVKKYVKLMELPQLVNNHISPIAPIRLNYTIQVDKASTYGEFAFDLEVPSSLVTASTESSGPAQNTLVQEGMMLLTEFNTISSQLEPQFASLEKKSHLLSLQLNSSANKYQFFHKLAEDPAPMLKDYMKSTANALKVLSGDDGFDEDTVRRSNFYQENEAVLFENLGVLLSNGRI